MFRQILEFKRISVIITAILYKPYSVYTNNSRRRWRNSSIPSFIMEIYFKITRDFSWQETLQIGNEGGYLIKNIESF